VLAALLGSTPVLWAWNGGPRPLESALSGGTPWQLALQLRAPAEETSTAWIPSLRDELQAHYPGGRFAGSIFASPMPGEVMLWALAPEIPVSLYTQLYLFPEQHWKDCTTVASAEPGWWEILDRWRVNLVVIDEEFAPKLGERLRQDAAWQILSDVQPDTTGHAKGPLFIALRRVPKQYETMKHER
jgi:hypothetical protein